MDEFICISPSLSIIYNIIDHKRPNCHLIKYNNLFIPGDAYIIANDDNGDEDDVDENLLLNLDNILKQDDIQREKYLKSLKLKKKDYSHK